MPPTRRTAKIDQGEATRFDSRRNVDDVACPLFRGHIMQIIGAHKTLTRRRWTNKALLDPSIDLCDRLIVMVYTLLLFLLV